MFFRDIFTINYFCDYFVKKPRRARRKRARGAESDLFFRTTKGGTGRKAWPADVSPLGQRRLVFSLLGQRGA